jgi:Flp pilus assembly protein TadB
MSRERARRRAEREAAAARAHAANTLRQQKRSRRQARVRALRPVRTRRPQGVLARKRRAQNGAVLLGFVLVQLLAWLLLQTWTARLAVLVLSAFLVPVVVTLAFDRRS